jgi:hypothetical protein
MPKEPPSKKEAWTMFLKHLSIMIVIVIVGIIIGG